LPASDRLEEVRRGSFLPPTSALRSRGSPRFLEWFDFETHACKTYAGVAACIDRLNGRGAMVVNAVNAIVGPLPFIFRHCPKIQMIAAEAPNWAGMIRSSDSPADRNPTNMGVRSNCERQRSPRYAIGRSRVVDWIVVSPSARSRNHRISRYFRRVLRLNARAHGRNRPRLGDRNREKGQDQPPRAHRARHSVNGSKSHALAQLPHHG
jgi:hypothetical protein